MRWYSDNIIKVNQGAAKIKHNFSHTPIPTTDKLTIRLKSRLNLLLTATDKTRLIFTYVKILTLLTNLLVNRYFAWTFVKKGADKIKQNNLSVIGQYFVSACVSILSVCICRYEINNI